MCYRMDIFRDAGVPRGSASRHFLDSDESIIGQGFGRKSRIKVVAEWTSSEVPGCLATRHPDIFWLQMRVSWASRPMIEIVELNLLPNECLESSSGALWLVVRTFVGFR